MEMISRWFLENFLIIIYLFFLFIALQFIIIYLN